MINWISRLQFLRRIRLESSTSYFFAPGSAILRAHRDSKISIAQGAFRFGADLRPNRPSAAYEKSVLILERGAILQIDGRVSIAPGATIHIGEGAFLHFRGENTIAQNTIIKCNKRIVFEKGASTSWNVTLIDDDLHRFKRVNGPELRHFERDLILGENSGLQMNVVIPKAVHVGANAIVAANTVLRTDVPSDCVVYSDTTLRTKTGLTLNYENF